MRAPNRVTDDNDIRRWVRDSDSIPVRNVSDSDRQRARRAVAAHAEDAEDAEDAARDARAGGRVTWTDRAACLGQHPGWDIPDGQTRAAKDHSAPLRICAGCPVRVPCYHDALTAPGGTHGVVQGGAVWSYGRAVATSEQLGRGAG